MGCTQQKGCYTYGLLTQARPQQKQTKTRQFVRNAARPPCPSQTWCILRVHLEKRVLHSLPVDAGAATPETNKNTPISQKYSRPPGSSRPWCILRVHLRKRVLHLLAVGAGAATPETHIVTQKKHQFVRKIVRPTCTSKAWCTLRMHCHKWVLHSLPVDAGASTPETHKNTPTGQKCSMANLHMKEWCILIQQVSRIQRNVCPFPSLPPAHNCRYTMQKP
jgi:hypothetical protein